MLYISVTCLWASWELLILRQRIYRKCAWGIWVSCACVGEQGKGGEHMLYYLTLRSWCERSQWWVRKSKACCAFWLEVSYMYTHTGVCVCVCVFCFCYFFNRDVYVFVIAYVVFIIYCCTLAKRNQVQHGRKAFDMWASILCVYVCGSSLHTHSSKGVLSTPYYNISQTSKEYCTDRQHYTEFTVKHKWLKSWYWLFNWPRHLKTFDYFVANHGPATLSSVLVKHSVLSIQWNYTENGSELCQKNGD